MAILSPLLPIRVPTLLITQFWALASYLVLTSLTASLRCFLTAPSRLMSTCAPASLAFLQLAIPLPLSSTSLAKRTTFLWQQMLYAKGCTLVLTCLSQPLLMQVPRLPAQFSSTTIPWLQQASPLRVARFVAMSTILSPSPRTTVLSSC